VPFHGNRYSFVKYAVQMAAEMNRSKLTSYSTFVLSRKSAIYTAYLTKFYRFPLKVRCRLRCQGTSSHFRDHLCSVFNSVASTLDLYNIENQYGTLLPVRCCYTVVRYKVTGPPSDSWKQSSSAVGLSRIIPQKYFRGNAIRFNFNTTWHTS